MSFKEVTALRKSGALDKALELARRDYSANIDHYSSSALFWTLKSICEKKIQDGDLQNAAMVFSELQSVFQNVDDDEGFAQRSLIFLEQKLTPVYSDILRAMNDAKTGLTEEAYYFICQLDFNDFPVRVIDNIAWIIFYHLRAHIQNLTIDQFNDICEKYFSLGVTKPSLVHSQILNIAIKYSGLHTDFSFIHFIEKWGVNTFSNDDMEANPDFAGSLSLKDRAIKRCFLDRSVTLNDVYCLFAREEHDESKHIEKILSRAYSSILYKDDVEEKNLQSFFSDADEYVSRLRGTTPCNEYHSRILESVLWKIDNNRLRWYKHFFESWGFGSSFMDEDWNSTQKDGKTIPSTAEKALGKYEEALKASGTNTYTPEYKALLSTALEKLSNNENITRRLARIEYQEGNAQKAVRLTEELIRTHTGKFYFWTELAEYVENTNIELCISCCAKALLASPEEKYVGKIHLIFGSFLCGKGMYGEALHEAEAYKKITIENGWPVRAQYNTLKSKIPENTIEVSDNNPIYRQFERHADEYIYSNIEGHDMVLGESKIEEKIDGKKRLIFYLYDSNNESYRVNPNAFGLDRKATVGSCFNVKYILNEGRKKIVLVKPIDKIDVLKYDSVVIDNINSEKKVFHVVNRNIQLVVPISRAPGKIKIGDILEVAVKERTKEGKTFVSLLGIRNTNKDCSFVKKFDGILKIKENEKGIFGFVNDVYIHRKFLTGLANEDTVHGIGIFTNGRFNVLSLEKDL